MNNDNRQHLLRSLEKDIRYDGRKKTDYRDIEVEVGISSTAEGSARVKIGDTEVLVGVKLQIEKPFPDRPEEGNLMVGAELLPLSNSKYELGPPSIDSIELARVIDRGIRESHSIDVKKLLIERGEKAWSVMVDICPINSAGNLFDAGFLGAILALNNAKIPKYENGEVNYKEKTKNGLPLTKTPISVTVIKIGDTYVVDPLPEEEDALDARLTVTVTEEGKICALQKGGDMPLTLTDVEEMLTLGIEKTEELRKYLN